MKNFTNIVITGASSGIGAALAHEFAAPGAVLALTGRDAGRLEAVAADCRAKGATVVAGRVDVVDRAAFATFLTAFDDAHPVDLVIANAGISIDKDNSSLDDFSVIRKTFDVNVGGVLNTVEPLLPRLTARKRGQIGIVSSLAGFIGLPYSASYNASKAAIRVWGESIRYVLKKDGIGVSVICPGFVESPMTASAPFPTPFLMPAARSAKIIRRGLARNQARIAFPVPTKAAVWLGQVLPGGWTARLLGA
ncbi:MAG: SDR family NAD(P)-dependent oxidoreductase [Alphaproteobacteria bacterium]|nr:SDR family NAD(P)-dependent oxidoreductase [Alphaproteobacteria bacterium]